MSFTLLLEPNVWLLVDADGLLLLPQVFTKGPLEKDLCDISGKLEGISVGRLERPLGSHQS